MKRNFKKAISNFLAAAMIFGTVAGIRGFDFGDLAIKAEAATEYTNGYYTYTVDENGNATIIDCDALISGDVEIPSTLDGYSVTSIGEKAFYTCSNLTSIKIPDSIASIGYAAFCFCENLTSITVDSSNALYSSDEYGVLFNKDKTVLMQYPIGNTRTSYVIPDGVINIGEAAFYYCGNNLTDVIIPDTVTDIGDSAFFNCANLTNIIIPNRVTSIGVSSFYKCGRLTDIKIPDNVTSLGFGAFSNCDGLETVTIGNSITNIEEETFSECDSLTRVIISDRVTSIGRGAFRMSNSLTDVYYVGTREKWETINIDSENTPLVNATIHYNYEEKEEQTTKPTVLSTTKPAVEEIIKKPSTTEVKYGETLILHVDFTNIPADAKIEWSVEGEGVTIKPSEDGKTCAVTSTATGDVTITAKYVDANGVEHVSEQEIESNASLWQKIVSFFKNLFGINRIIEQAIKFDR